MNAFQDRHPLTFQAICALARVASLSIIIATLVSIQAHADTPTIRLFPTTVVEDLRQTSSVAKEMETGLQEVIGRLDQQQQLYQESKCDGAESDSGCAQGSIASVSMISSVRVFVGWTPAPKMSRSWIITNGG